MSNGVSRGTRPVRRVGSGVGSGPARLVNGSSWTHGLACSGSALTLTRSGSYRGEGRQRVLDLLPGGRAGLRRATGQASARGATCAGPRTPLPLLPGGTTGLPGRRIPGTQAWPGLRVQHAPGPGGVKGARRAESPGDARLRERGRQGGVPGIGRARGRVTLRGRRHPPFKADRGFRVPLSQVPRPGHDSRASPEPSYPQGEQVPRPRT